MKFKKTFIVDDDPVFHFLIKKLFAANAIETESVYFMNGLEAFRNIKESIVVNDDELPDLILLDINMPVMDGWQFLEEFKEFKNNFSKNVAVYIVSSSDNATDRAKAVSFKDVITGYLVKPLNSINLKFIFGL